LDFLSNSDGDIAIVNGDFALVDGTDEIVQFLQQSLRLFLAEWFLDQTLGFPYFDEVFIKNPNPVTLDSLFKIYILECPGILELVEFNLDYDASTRDVSITGVIRAEDGNADFSVQTILPGGV
jgi:hypothetical protein